MKRDSSASQKVWPEQIDVVRGTVPTVGRTGHAESIIR